MKKFRIKNLFIVLLVIIIIFLIGFFSLNYTINNNREYTKELKREISDNYSVDSDIDNVNIYGEYYIVKTKNDVIVLDKNYKEVLKESNSWIALNKNNYDLVYRTNKLMYEETVRKGESLIYNYYDVYTYENITSIVLE